VSDQGIIGETEVSSQLDLTGRQAREVSFWWGQPRKARSWTRSDRVT
jgi:hypothetical protein